jgi:DNA-binding MarR family transcriptional regulator
MATKRLDPPTQAGKLREIKLQHVLGFQLGQVSIVSDAIFMKHVGHPLDLRQAEYTLLALVTENSGSTSVRLSKALSVTAPNITAWVDRLEARGLLRRERSESDRRAQMLHPTQKGKQLVNTAITKLLKAEKNTLKSLSNSEQTTLLELLHKVANLRSEI